MKSKSYDDPTFLVEGPRNIFRSFDETLMDLKYLARQILKNTVRLILSS